MQRCRSTRRRSSPGPVAKSCDLGRMPVALLPALLVPLASPRLPFVPSLRLAPSASRPSRFAVLRSLRSLRSLGSPVAHLGLHRCGGGFGGQKGQGVSLARRPRPAPSAAAGYPPRSPSAQVFTRPSGQEQQQTSWRPSGALFRVMGRGSTMTRTGLITPGLASAVVTCSIGARP